MFRTLVESHPSDQIALTGRTFCDLRQAFWPTVPFRIAMLKDYSSCALVQFRYIIESQHLFIAL